MALYGQNGEIEYLELDEVSKFLNIYSGFASALIKVKGSRGLRRIYAANCLLDKWIPAVKRLPKDARYLSNETIIFHDTALSKLEQKCAEIVKKHDK